jgi:2-desacetyl-2-hydroxyethyl bacteriochlorophyllide A dehydrogenase
MDAERQKPTVSIFGACVPRDAFAMQRPDDYVIEQYVSFTSPMSAMMQKPNNDFVLTVEDLEQKGSAFSRRCLCQDCNKEDISYLAKKHSDWLVLDLADTRFSIAKFPTSGATFTTSNAFLNHKGKLEQLLQESFTKTLCTDFSDAEWDETMKRFLDEILKQYKPENIIFFEYYHVYDYISKEIEITSFHKDDIERRKKQNALLERLNRIAEERLKGCHIVRMPEGVLANANHKWGKHPLHYVNLYYEYAAEAIDLITAKKPSAQEQAELAQLLLTYNQKFADLRKAIQTVERPEKPKQNAYRIVFTEKENVACQAFQIAQPMKNQVLVKVYYTLISAGTEKAYLMDGKNTAHHFPIVPGYSSVGVVVQIGERVKKFSVGDRVFVSNGGHASYNLRPETDIIKIPDNVPFEEAVFTRIASFPMAAIRRARLEMGESVVIVGLGMLGLLGVQIARLAGAVPLIAIGNREIRQEKAKQYGADYVFSPSDADLSKKIFDITQRITTVKGASVIVEASGTEDGLLTALTYAARNARLMLNGSQREMTKPVDFYKYVHTKGVEIVGVHGGTRPMYNSIPGNWTAVRDCRTVLNYMADGRIHARDMISEFVSPEDAPAVYDRLVHDKAFPLGVIFDWRAYHGERIEDNK